MRKPIHAEWSPVSRRQALAGIGTLATAGAGVAVLDGSTRGVRASVTVDGFSVSDGEFTAESLSPVVAVDVSYSYDAGVNAVSSVVVECLVGETVVASEEFVSDKTTFDGSVSLRGDVTDSAAWSQSDFAPEVASSVSREVDVTVRLSVRDSSESEIVGASASDTATVVVSHPRESRLTASVGGTGSIVTPRE